MNYIFFRNHWIDAAKLEAAMVADPHAACYCCQCSWQSILGTDGPKSLGEWATGGALAAPEGGSGDGGTSDGVLKWGLR